MHTIKEKFNELITIISRLRSSNGCPWDRKQTSQTTKSYLLEETLETIEAIEEDDPDHVCEELGDLLFLIVFLSRLYQEKGLFTINEVLAGINEKMIRRHPHVFGDAAAGPEQDLRKRWLTIKASEKKGKRKKQTSKNDSFASIPNTLSALRRAQLVSEHAAQTDLDWLDLKEALKQLDLKTKGLKEALATEKKQDTFEEIGRLLFVISNIGRLTGINTEGALSASTSKFINRLTKMK